MDLLLTLAGSILDDVFGIFLRLNIYQDVGTIRNALLARVLQHVDMIYTVKSVNLDTKTSLLRLFNFFDASNIFQSLN